MGLFDSFRPNATAKAVAELFALCPGEWTLDEYLVSHKSGVAVWIANKDYGLHVEAGGRQAPGFGGRAGGPASRRLIWRAYLKWRADNAPLEPHPVVRRVQAALEACRAHTAQVADPEEPSPVTAPIGMGE